MKKLSLVLLIVFLFIGFAQAKDFKVRATIISWTDATEASFPVTFKLYDATTNLLLTSVTAAVSPVVNLAMPDITIVVPDNTVKKVKFYATVTDAAGNASAKCPDSNELTLIGIDTIPPAGVNTIMVGIIP